MNKERRAIPILAIWAIWKWRNGRIFSSKKESNASMVASIITLYSSLELARKNRNTYGRSLSTTTKRIRNGRDPLILSPTDPPCAFFDGAAQQGICACGVYIRTTNDQAIEIYWNAGSGSNNRAEAVALTGLLSFCIFLNIPNMKIYGDSRIIIDHVLQKHYIKNIHLAGWLDRIAVLWNSRRDYSISHIDKNQNKEADTLSKMGLTAPQGIWRAQITTVSHCFQIQDFRFPGI